MPLPSPKEAFNWLLSHVSGGVLCIWYDHHAIMLVASLDSSSCAVYMPISDYPLMLTCMTIQLTSVLCHGICSRVPKRHCSRRACKSHAPCASSLERTQLVKQRWAATDRST